MSDSVPRHPWTGNRWSKDLLLLGESHYVGEGSDPEDPDLTRTVVQDVVGGRRLRFFTSLERAVTGCALGAINPAEFWQTVAFANFCPGAAPADTKRATPEMITRGVAQFGSLLRQLRPRRVVFFTKRCWDATTRLEDMDWKKDPTFEHEGRDDTTGFFGSEGYRPGAYAVHVHHPNARGWSTDRWHPLIRDFLAHPVPA